MAAAAPKMQSKVGDKGLHVNSYNPYAEVTLRSRVRQVLHTHQGRDKVFKVAQYTLRLLLWAESANVNWHFMSRTKGANATTLEQTLTTLTNGRRMFRIGRFVAEFVRIRATLIKCSEIQYSPPAIRFTLQLQMLLDIIARALMCVKSVLEDVVFLVQKGLLNRDLEQVLLRHAAKLAVPVLLIDLYLNSIRLAQGVVDARAQPQEHPPVATALIPASSAAVMPAKGFGMGTPPRTPTAAQADGNSTFSLLSTYQKVDRIRKQSASSPSPVIGRTSSNLEAILVAQGHKRQSPPPTRVMTSPTTIVTPTTATALPSEVESSGESTPTPDDGRLSPEEPLGNDSSLVCWDSYRKKGFADHRQGSGDLVPSPGEVMVDSYWKLFWQDFEMHWIGVTQIKLLLDVMVGVARVFDWRTGEAFFASCGLMSGLLSVYRVWTYGH